MGLVLATVLVLVSEMWIFEQGIPKTLLATLHRTSFQKLEIVEKKKELGATLNQRVAVSRYLHHLGVETLPHFRSSVGQQHRAVSVDVNQSSSLKKQMDNCVKSRTNLTKQVPVLQQPT